MPHDYLAIDVQPEDPPPVAVALCASGCGEPAWVTRYYSYEFCEGCQEERQSCENCGTEMWRDDMAYSQEYESYYCSSSCRRAYEDSEEYVSESEIEEQDTEVDIPVLSAEGLGFEARYFNPERGDQLTSVELEFGRDPEGVARALYNNGMSPASTVGGYHEQARRNRGSSYVEYDGSVSGGGEMVISMVRLPDEQETLRLWHTVKVLRDRVHAGDNNLNMQCGCHIHVNALGRDLNSIISTVVAYNHIEDILYRMSAAHYKHHRLDNGNEYCETTEKEITDKERFRASFGTRRYYGLNVGNYLSYRHDCRCGAGFDHADRCQCDDSSFYKPTLEFRLFNTTANGAKLHAFIAVCQALTHYGTNRTLLSSDLPPMEYEGTNQGYTYTEYVERLTWMLTELPFSASERNSIRYCIRNSSLKDMLEQGVAIGQVSAEDVQAILHEDELLAVDEYVVPERVEEAVSGRNDWRITDYFTTSGQRLWVDMNGRFRDPTNGRYATPHNPYSDPAPVALVDVGCGNSGCTHCYPEAIASNPVSDMAQAAVYAYASAASSSGTQTWLPMPGLTPQHVADNLNWTANDDEVFEF